MVIKKDPYDHTSTVRSARYDEKMKRDGCRRLSGWLNKESADKLQALLDADYAPDVTAAVSLAIAEAYQRLREPGGK